MNSFRSRKCGGLVRFLLVLVLLGMAGTGPGAQEPQESQEAGETQEERTVDIRWTAVPGAREYTFEVRNAQKAAILKRTVKQPVIQLRLPEGSYEMRSRAVDRFRRQTPWSDWAPLRIRYALPPEILSVSPEEYQTGTNQDEGAHENKRLVELRGKNFVRDTQVRLSVNAQPVAVQQLNFVDADTLRFALDASAPEGEYDLVVVNPGELKTRRLAAFRVKRDPNATDIADTGEPTGEPGGPNAEARRETLPEDVGGESGLLWSSLVPGLPDFTNGRYVQGSLWLGAFLGASVAAFGGYQASADASNGALGNPFYPSFSNPIFLLGLLSTSRSTNFGIYILNSNEVYNGVVSEYSAGRSRYHTFGGAALLIYVTHFALNIFAGDELPVYDPATGTDGVSVRVTPVRTDPQQQGSFVEQPPDIEFAWTISF